MTLRISTWVIVGTLVSVGTVGGQTPAAGRQTTDARVFVSATNGVTSNLEFNRKSRDAFEAIFGGGGRVRHRGLWVTYELASHTFSSETSRTRISQAIEARYGHDLARRWRAEVSGDVAINGTPDSRSPVRRAYAVSPRLTYRGPGGHRVRVFSLHQARRATDDHRDDTTRHYMGLEYRRTLARQHFWEAGGRIESSTGVNSRNAYRRHGVWVAYSWPVTKRDALQVRTEYRVRDFSSRIVETSDGPARRVDHRVTSGVTWIRPVADGIDWRFDYEHETNRSNDARRIYSVHVVLGRVVVAWP